MYNGPSVSSKPDVPAVATKPRPARAARTRRGWKFYALLGIVILVVSFIVLDKLTPGSLWKEIMEERNTALAVLSGAIAIGISLIIAAAIW